MMSQQIGKGNFKSLADVAQLQRSAEFLRIQLPNLGRTSRLFILFVVAVFATSLSASVAEPIYLYNMPLGPAPPVNGLLLTVEDAWVRGFGYRPFRLTFSTSNQVPVAADRKLRIECFAKDWFGEEALVARDVTISQGAMSATATISVLQNYAFEHWEINVYEAGQLLTELTVSSPVANHQWRNINEATPAILFIDRDAPTVVQRHSGLSRRQFVGSGSGNSSDRLLPNVVGIAGILPVAYSQSTVHLSDPTASDAAILNYFDGQYHLALRHPGDLPDRWIDFTCFDLVFISSADLLYMRKEHPAQWKALSEWTVTGPTLCVHDIGDNFERLKMLETVFSLPNLKPMDASQNMRAGWAVPNEADQGAIRGIEDAASSSTRAFARHNTTGKTPFVIRDFGLGKLVAISSSDPFPLALADCAWILNSLEKDRWNWRHRHGIAPGRENRSYWNFLIPGVGLPPVNAFRILITLFVIIIGPVNYHLLRRWQRIHLLLLTVPAGAALVTVSLIVYAFVADGLGVRLRSRSFTKLDQRSGQAASWARQSYYAGLAPSRGISFPSDVAFYPIEPGNDAGSRSQSRESEWEPERLLLTRGFLRSRVTSQFMIVRVRESRAELIVKEDEKSSQAPQVENLLRTKIHHLALVDSKGGFYWAQDIEAGAKFRPVSRPANEAFTELRQVLNDSRPQMPTRVPSQFFNYRQRRLRYSEDEPRSITSVMEQNIVRIINSGSDALGPQTFLAVVEECPEVTTGTKLAKEEASFHIIEGRW